MIVQQIDHPVKNELFSGFYMMMIKKYAYMARLHIAYFNWERQGEIKSDHITSNIIWITTEILDVVEGVL